MEDKNFDDIKLPFAAVTTDVQTGEEIIIENGSLIEAVRASISIPGIFTPVRHQDRFLVDGGIVNPVPADAVRNMGADIVLAVNVVSSVDAAVQEVTLPDETQRKRTQQTLTSAILNTRLAAYVKDKVDFSSVVSVVESLSEMKELLEKKFTGPNIIETIMQSISIMENEIIQMRFEQNPPDIFIKPPIEGFGLMEFYKAEEIIKVGEDATEPVVPLIKQLIK